MAELKILAEYPAYKIVEAPEGYMFRDGDTFGIAYRSYRGDTLYNFFKLGSVAGYAVQYGEDVEKALADARERGHELHYAFGLGVSLTSHVRPQERHFGLSYGDEIKAFGRRFRLDRAPNNNVKLTELTD